MKIQANELMIGNLLFLKFTNEVVEILGINAHETNKEITHTLSLKKGLSLYYEKVSVLKPIEITEEWLLSAGWEFQYELQGYKNYCSMVLPFDDILFNIKTKKYNWNCWENVSFPKYIHQLQNLYFALTNEQLKIK